MAISTVLYCTPISCRYHSSIADLLLFKGSKPSCSHSPHIIKTFTALPIEMLLTCSTHTASADSPQTPLPQVSFLRWKPWSVDPSGTLLPLHRACRGAALGVACLWDKQPCKSLAIAPLGSDHTHTQGSRTWEGAATPPGDDGCRPSVCEGMRVLPTTACTRPGVVPLASSHILYTLLMCDPYALQHVVYCPMRRRAKLRDGGGEGRPASAR